MYVIFFLLWTLARYPYATEQEALSLILDEAYNKFNDYYYYYYSKYQNVSPISKVNGDFSGYF